MWQPFDERSRHLNRCLHLGRGHRLGPSCLKAQSRALRFQQKGEISMLQNIRKNWKTSLGGAVLIAVAALEASGISIPGIHVDLGMALITGVPLMLAKDATTSD
jgi:hypothetical protein